jgi:hypothetical protein
MMWMRKKMGATIRPIGQVFSRWPLVFGWKKTNTKTQPAQKEWRVDSESEGGNALIALYNMSQHCDVQRESLLFSVANITHRLLHLCQGRTRTGWHSLPVVNDTGQRGAMSDLVASEMFFRWQQICDEYPTEEFTLKCDFCKFIGGIGDMVEQ